MFGIELPATDQPQVMQLHHVIEDEEEGDDPGRPLQDVADVAGIGIGTRVRNRAAR